MPAFFRCLVSFMAACAFTASAQQLPSARITRAINESELIRLPQKPHRLARPEFDRGPAPAALRMDRMMLVLKRAPEQTAQLKTLLDAQLRASSPQFHKWLTPEQFGAQFGPADQDLTKIVAWLQSHGFTVEPGAKGKGTIGFSGNAQQVSEAFHTSIHRFVVNGKEHWANTTSPLIPAALAPLVAGVSTLNSFHPRPLLRNQSMAAKPRFTSSTGDHALAPADYATIYNFNSLYQATPAIDGTGATIAVVGGSAPDPEDISDFRAEFGLKTYAPQFLYPAGVPTDTEATGEATLDVSWAGAVAPGAAINYVAIPDTFADSGLLLTETYIVDNNMGDIVTESVGVCEAYSDQFLANFIEATREQAAAQGMTYIVAAGDSGPYGCDDFNSELSVYDPTMVSVNLLAASPYVTAVGGTMFNDIANPTQFWNAATPGVTGTALSYIPEDVWQQSCDSPFCFLNILAGSGGQSSFYPKPAWQSGVTGIPQDGTRDIPDVALTASGHDPYLVCFQSSCKQGDLYEFYGTSAAAPSFAGMMALVKQKTGSRLGSINPQLYTLAAAEDYSTCNGSLNTVASTCIFNDITVGNNAVNGETNFGTPTAIYQATVGYDLATGLGSISLANLASKWNVSGERATSTTLVLSPTTIVHGAVANMTITVTPQSGSGVPTGPVDLNSSTASLGTFLLTAGTAQSSTAPLAGGSYSVFAAYGGDGTFAPGTSNAVTVSVSPEPSVIVSELDTPCETGPFCSVTTAAYGSPLELSASVSGHSGIGAPSGTVTFTDTGADSGGSLLLNNDGSAVLTPIGFAVGTHTVTMKYPGDASFLPATGPPLTFTITRAPTFITLTPGSFCGLPSTPFSLTGQVSTLYGPVEEGTLTVLSANPQITASVTASLSKITLPSLPDGLNSIVVSYSGSSNYLPSTTTLAVNISAGTCLAAMVNSADYQAGVAPQEIVSIFGVDLGSSTISAPAGAPLPQSLNGTTVTITDSAGTTKPADLFFVSPGQINCAIPQGLASGPSTVQLTGPQGTSQFPSAISPVSPGLFSADGSGNGLASAQIVRDHQGQITTTTVTSTPIAFNGDDLYLVLYGTGSANVTSDDFVEVLFDGQAAIPNYIGPQGGFEGLDQINVPIPYSLAGFGSVSIQVMIDGLVSNAVTVPFQ